MEKVIDKFRERKAKLDENVKLGIDLRDSYDEEFAQLRDQTASYKESGTYLTSEGENALNVVKNRYKDIMPYDHTRVKLKNHGGSTDYINASFIKGIGGKQYIASQGPLQSTVNDFWCMIWEYSVHVIVMACNEYEGGKLRCKRYWPEAVGEEFRCPNFTIKLEKCEEHCQGEYLIREMSVVCHSNGGAESPTKRNVVQLHYKAWPDREAPRCIPTIWEIIDKMREYHESFSSDTPLVVHCSAGCGRTGTIIVLDYVQSLLKLDKLDDDFSLFAIISEMRRQRMAIVQSLSQYMFVHDAVSYLFEKYLTLNSQHDYVNVPSNPPITDELISGLDSTYEPVNLSPDYTTTVERQPSAEFTDHLYGNSDFDPRFISLPAETSVNGPSRQQAPGAHGSSAGQEGRAVRLGKNNEYVEVTENKRRSQGGGPSTPQYATVSDSKNLVPLITENRGHNGHIYESLNEMEQRNTSQPPSVGNTSESSTSTSENITGRLMNRVRNAVMPKASKDNARSESSLEPGPVYYNGKNISFPHRVGKPKGKRPNNRLNS